MTKVQPLRIQDEIIKVAEMKSDEEHTSRSAALRQFLYEGVEDYLLKLCSVGRISLGKVAEILHKSVYDLQESARKKGIELGVEVEDYEKGKEVLE